MYIIIIPEVSPVGIGCVQKGLVQDGVVVVAVKNLDLKDEKIMFK